VLVTGAGRGIGKRLAIGFATRGAKVGLLARSYSVDLFGGPFFASTLPGGELAKAYLFGTGFASDLPGGLFAFLKTDPAVALPDVQFLFNAGSMAAKPYLPPFLPSFPDSFGCRVALLRPQSRGRVAWLSWIATGLTMTGLHALGVSLLPMEVIFIFTHRRVHWSPPMRKVASRSSQHSKIFGQPASSQTVCRPSLRTRAFSSV